MPKTKLEPVVIPGGRKAPRKSTAAQRKTPAYRAGYRDANAHWTVVGRDMREDAYRVGLATGATLAQSVLSARLDELTVAGEIGDVGNAASVHVIERQRRETQAALDYLKQFVDRLAGEAAQATHRIARTQAEIIHDALFGEGEVR